MNMGAYFHVAPRLQTAMLAEDRHLHDHIPYAGRGPSASTATGFGSVHAQEQVWIVTVDTCSECYDARCTMQPPMALRDRADRLPKVAKPAVTGRARQGPGGARIRGRPGQHAGGPCAC